MEACEAYLKNISEKATSIDTKLTNMEKQNRDIIELNIKLLNALTKEVYTKQSN